MVPAHGLPDDPISPRILVSLFAPTLGWDKSEEAIALAIQRLGIRASLLSVTQALAVLDDLATERGIVGVTARFVRSRGDFQRALGPPSERSGVREVTSSRTSDPGPISRREPQRRDVARLDVREIVPLLANTIGQEKAEEAVLTCIRRLGLPDDRLDLAQASLLFDALAGQPGIVGVTARFAKARLILKFGT